MDIRSAQQLQSSIPWPARPRSLLDSFLLRMAHRAVIPQLKQAIGMTPPAEHLARKGMARLGWRALRRELVYRLSGQTALQHQTIQPHWKRGLFLYFGAEQIGDALMDLAPRSLLQQAGLKMDLLTSPTIAKLFQSDPWFERVSCQARDLQTGGDYDFVITLSNKRRALLPKRRHFAGLPWVSLHESFCGPDFDRGGFATQRLADLLGLQLSRNAFDIHARQKLTSDTLPAIQLAAGAQTRIAICVGGVDPRRTYQHWELVVAELVAQGAKDFVLVGSNNGAAAARQLVEKFSADASIDNQVGATSIHQTRAILRNASVLACSDGGLMHVAAADDVPMVALFCATIRPEWRLRLQKKPAAALSSSTVDVNAIPPVAVAQQILSLHQHAACGTHRN
jgi:heptosyltransferase-2